MPHCWKSRHGPYYLGTLCLSELDNEGVVDDPDDFTPEQISAEVEVTDDMMEQSNDKRSEAMSAMGEG